MLDMVNKPPHYTHGEIECIDALRACLTPEEFNGFCLGNSIKYLWRANHKGSREENLEKAIWYAKMAKGEDPRGSQKGSE